MNPTRLSFGLLCLLLTACSGNQVLNSLTTSRDVEQATNIVYDAATDGRLDLYRPIDVRNAPVVVFFHGGRWTEGDKEDYEFVGKALAARGYLAILPEVRHYPIVRFPAFVEDGAKVVKWAHENAEQYGGSAQKLFLMGHSSGGHIAAMLTFNEEYLKKVGGARDWVDGFIGLAGAYDFMPITDPVLRDIFGPPEVFEKSQPIYYVDGRNPPVLLIHGEDDDVVAVRNTRNLAHSIKSANGQVETVIYLEMGNSKIVNVLAPRLQGRADVMSSIVDFISRTVDNPVPNAGVAGKAFEEPPELPDGQELPPATRPLGDEAPVPEQAPEALPSTGFQIEPAEPKP